MRKRSGFLLVPSYRFPLPSATLFSGFLEGIRNREEGIGRVAGLEATALGFNLALGRIGIYSVGITQKSRMRRLNSDKVLFSFAGGRERCDRNGHAVFLRPRVDLATTGSEITGISTSSTKLK